MGRLGERANCDLANCEGDLRNPDYQTTQLSEKEGFIQDLCFKIR